MAQTSMWLDIILGLMVLCLVALLRVLFLWGQAKGELDEFNRSRTPQEGWEEVPNDERW